jgi:hypothetical protein
MLIKIQLTFLFFMMCFANSWGQIDTHLQEKSIFLAKTGLMSEFFKRFNKAEDLLSGYYSDKDSISLKKHKAQFNLDSLKREILILSLFDSMYLAKSNKDSVLSFIRQVTDKNIILSLYDDNWYAKTKALVKFKNKPDSINLVFKSIRLYSDKKVSYWTLKACYANFLNINPADNSVEFKLNPLAHEDKFSDIYIYSKQKNNICHLAEIGYQVDYRSIFFFAIKSGDLSVETIDDRTFEFNFLQIPNWIVIVKNYNRNSLNSGWLISNIIPANDAQKSEFKLKQLLLR